jgi:multisite-specific tRNA:(cytosine-C5)-methyltransferase
MRLVQGMFPLASAGDDNGAPVERCIRVYPHFQDTGGFFITALEKLSEIRARPEKEGKSKPVTPAESKARTPSVEATSESSQKRPRDEDTEAPPTPKKVKTESSSVMDTSVAAPETTTNGTLSTTTLQEDDYAAPKDSGPPGGKKKDVPYEEPYKYLSVDHPEITKIYDFYEISSRFPKDRYMVRNATGEPVKAVYYTSEKVRDILVCNEGQGIKFVQAGVKMFMKQDAQGQDICRWRIQSEGIPILEPWAGEDRVIRLYKRETLRKLLIEMFPRIGNGEWKRFDEIGQRAFDIGMGCCVLRVETSDTKDGFR